jgi:hypothetical protein
MRVANAITLTDEQRRTLTKWTRGRSTPAIRGVKEAEIIRKITQETPPNATQWSTRSMARAVGVSKDTVQRVWRDNGLKPHRNNGCKVSNNPKFAEKLVDIVGLYLDPPEHALVLSCDEKSQMKALGRTQKSLPLFPGRLKTLTHDYKRNDTTTLFAAIELAEGKIIAECLPRRRHQEWIKFLKKIDAETPLAANGSNSIRPEPHSPSAAKRSKPACAKSDRLWKRHQPGVARRNIAPLWPTGRRRASAIRSLTTCFEYQEPPALATPAAQGDVSVYVGADRRRDVHSIAPVSVDRDVNSPAAGLATSEVARGSAGCCERGCRGLESNSTRAWGAPRTDDPATGCATRA